MIPIHKTMNKKKCRYCNSFLINEAITNKLICSDENCRRLGEKKKSKTYSKDDFKPKIENIVKSYTRLENRSKFKSKSASNVCKLCKNTIRKNYPFGVNSKSRIVGHRFVCANNPSNKTNKVKVKKRRF